MSASPPPDTPLQLPQLLAWLQEDGLLDAAQAAAMQAQAALLPTPALHPLCGIAHGTLTLDTLCAWLARRAGLPYLRIDPLHIDFSQVADVMTAGYAARFNILPVESTPERIVIATAQPYALAWQAQLGNLAPRKLSLVIANPLHIADAIAQFFSLASSVKV
ncbi:MAG: type II/IV secretion system protein, partial [Janthinobacterium sp.]